LLTSLLRFFEFSFSFGKLVFQTLDIFNRFLDRNGLGVAICVSREQGSKLINGVIYSTSTGLFSDFVASSARFNATGQFLWVGKTELRVVALKDVLVI